LKRPKTCKQCGKVFFVNRKFLYDQQLYCSWACNGASRKGKPYIDWADIVTGIERQYKMDFESEKEAHEFMYKKYKTVEVVAEKIGVSHCTLSKRFKRLGVVVRTKNRHKDVYGKIEAMNTSEMTVREIANIVGVDKSVVYYVMLAKGLNYRRSYGKAKSMDRD
jgi:predicted transcriptional regulator